MKSTDLLRTLCIIFGTWGNKTHWKQKIFEKTKKKCQKQFHVPAKRSLHENHIDVVMA